MSRVIVNQPHCVATGGSFENGLPFSLSMGCGTWGGNGFSDNLNWRHYLNTTRIVRPIPLRLPDLDELMEPLLSAAMLRAPGPLAHTISPALAHANTARAFSLRHQGERPHVRHRHPPALSA